MQVKSHILAFALQGLDANARQTLHTIAAFRMPATYDTLVSLLVGDDKAYRSETTLIATLSNLEDRGLLGWDRRANRYDLHPLVRGVAWNSVDEQARQGIYEALNVHFGALPQIDEEEINSLEDLAPAIELYNTLIGLGRYDDAYEVFSNRLSDTMFYRLGTTRQLSELLMLFFPDGLDQLPRLSTPYSQGYVLNDLALSLRDQPGRAIVLFRRSNDIDEKENDQRNVSIVLSNLSDVLRFCGALYDAERAARRALVIDRQLSDER